MFRIGEFSMLSSISINMLRHYNKIGLLIPHSIDKFTSYRYYSKEQLIIANSIVALKSIGFGLKEIEAMQIENITQDGMETILKNKLKSKQQELALIQLQISQITNALSCWGKEEYSLSIAIKKIPARKVVSHRARILHFHDEGILWNTLNQECKKSNVRLSSPDYATSIQHEINFDENYIDVEVQLSIEKLGNDTDIIKFREIPECKVASLIYQGQYARLQDINIYVAKWVEQNGYELYGKVFSIYYNSPENEQNENKFITEVCFPIKNKTRY